MFVWRTAMARASAPLRGDSCGAVRGGFVTASHGARSLVRGLILSPRHFFTPSGLELVGKVIIKAAIEMSSVSFPRFLKPLIRMVTLFNAACVAHAVRPEPCVVNQQFGVGSSLRRSRIKNPTAV